MRQLSVDEFLASHSFEECYFSTESGNIYTLQKQDGGVVIADAKSNVGAGAQPMAYRLNDDDLARARLQVGKPFEWRRGNTTPLTQVIVVTGSHFTLGTPDSETAEKIAREETGGRTTTIRSQFWNAVKA